MQTIDTKELLSKYWQEFSQYLNGPSDILPKSNNTHNTWCNFALGTSLGTLEAVVNTKGSNRVELRIHGKNATETYDKLEIMYKNDFKKRIEKAEWDRMPSCILKRIYAEQKADIYLYDDWPRQFAWLKENLEVFYSYFQPKLAALKH